MVHGLERHLPADRSITYCTTSCNIIVIVFRALACLSRAEHVVEVLQEGLLHYLAVAEEESGWDIFRPRRHQHRLQIFVELRRAIPSGDLYTYALVASNEGRKPCERLPPRS